MELLVALLILMTMGMVLVVSNRLQRRFKLAVVEDTGDSDIKIAGEENEPDEAAGNSEELDELAGIIKAEHDNGNIERSKRLAVQLVETVFSHDIFTHGLKDQELLLQIRLLITFTVDVCLENGLPNAIDAQSAQNLFYEQISLRDREFYDEIQTSGAFSMYLLCTRSEVSNSTSIGKEFAALCKKANDTEYTHLGKSIFEYYLKLCADKIREANFVKQ
ncbi:hypothetical protein [Acetanaerobacterium elongatum]|uniref:Uncharacterized protein n=1 Tax=Acetanaerobacterium elongatum TaxID=258515 RepID=A0A1H0E2Y7_9FIRM|nr:hypothetical protein [Acetanaerobacterium elongatum]SDN76817.1 hypothetical protein SAMN05192585_13142 [Acetanaerobacterium elongatum]